MIILTSKRAMIKVKMQYPEIKGFFLVSNKSRNVWKLEFEYWYSKHNRYENMCQTKNATNKNTMTSVLYGLIDFNKPGKQINISGTIKYGLAQEQSMPKRYMGKILRNI